MWLDGRRVDTEDGTSPSGVLAWAKPTQTTIPPGGLENILLPAGVAIYKGRTCANSYLGNLYLVGGFSQNLRLTTGLRAWIMGITAPSNPLINGSGSGNRVGVATTSGPGLTASVIVWIQWWDEITGEGSPLSQASPEIACVDELINITNLPTTKPEDDFKIGGTTTASASTTITGVGTAFLDDVRVGDQISLSSLPNTFSIVKDVTSDTSLTVVAALGDGTTQRINVRRIMRPTHIRILYGVDGDLPRVVEQREVGCQSTVPAVLSIDDLGEAFTEDFSRFPMCRFAVEFHDRIFMSGDEEHPYRIYMSLIGQPERKAFLDLDTRSGATVIGLYRVRDSLYVGMAQGHEVINGWTEDDISIEPISPNLDQQPGLGLVCHFAVGLTPDGNAIVPTQFGPYLNDGASFYPLNKDCRAAWTRDLKARPRAYQDTFCYVDAERHVYAIWLGQHPRIPKARTIDTLPATGTTLANLTTAIVGVGTAFESDLVVGDQISLSSDPTAFSTVLSIDDDENIALDIPIGNGTSQTIGIRSADLISLNAYMVFDYQPVLPVEGGGMGPPRLSWDTQAREDEFASILLQPGAPNGVVVTGSCDGSMYRRNVTDNDDDSGDAGLKRVLIVEGADACDDVGGDFMHGKRFTNIELFAECEGSFFSLDLYPGDEKAWPAPEDFVGAEIARGPIRSYNRLGMSRRRQEVTIAGGTYQGTFEPKTVWTIPLVGMTGRRMTVAIAAYKATDFQYLGRTLYWIEGPAPRRITRYGS